MALVVKDRVQETTVTVGTISLVLTGAVSGFQSFSVIGNGNTTYYAVVGGTEWEVGIGTYTALGTTLSRDTVLSSSAGGTTKVTFSAGTKNVFVTYPADKSIYDDAAGNVIGLGTPASVTLTNGTGLPLTTGVTGTLPIANGGTGTTSTTFTNLTTNVTGTLPIANGGTGTTSTTFANLTTNVTGTLPVANGGTGITSLGTGVATFLGTPSSANLASAVTDETGSGSLVFATSPTIASPTFTSQSTFAAGTAAAPSVTTTGDTNTGIFFPAADTIAFAEGGAETMRIDSSGYAQGTVNGLSAGRMQAYQYYRLNSAVAGANATGAQSLFGVGVTLVGSTVYEFEISVSLLKTAGTTSHTVAVGFGGTATINNIGYNLVESDNSNPVPTSASASNFQTFTSATSTVITGAKTNATLYITLLYKGTVSINAGGTFIPQYTLSAAPGGAYTTQIGSYIKIAPLSASGANTNIGSWA